jgi:hypothetical protein
MIAGLAVASSTKFGDGCYNVYAEFDDCYTNRPNKIIIDFEE